jgi:ankyrin repeat protein
LLNKGMDINLIGFDGLTALHSAVLQNQPRYVSYLLKHGADVSIGVNYSHVFGKKEKSKMFGMNAVKLAEFASQKDKQDRSEIIRMLNDR